MNSHTAGPWNTADSGDIMSTKPVNVIATVTLTSFGNVMPQGANARLIAAAPEMLEALKLALKVMYEDPTRNVTVITGCSTTE